MTTQGMVAGDVISWHVFQRSWGFRKVNGRRSRSEEQKAYL